MAGIINYNDLINDDGSLDDLEKKIDSLEKKVLKSGESLRKALDLVSPSDADEIKRLTLEVEKFKKTQQELDKLRKESNKTKKKSTELTQKQIQALADEKEALRKQKAETRAIAKLKNTQAGSIENLRAKLSVVTIQWAKLTEEERENSERGKRLVRVKKELTEELKRVERQTGDTRRNVGNYREEVKLAIKELEAEKKELRENTAELRKQQSSLKRGGAEWKQYEKILKKSEERLQSINDELGETNKKAEKKKGGGLLSGITDKIDFPSAGGAGGGIASSFGSMLGSIGPIGVAIGAVVGGVVALGKAVLDVEKRFSQLRGEIQKTTGAVGAQLDTLTVSVASIVDVFGEDQKDVVNSLNTLMKEFGIGATEATELLEQGFLSSANSQGDMLDSVREYSTQIKAAGGDAKTLFRILDRSGKKGVFSDKGIDTVKEFGLRIREGSKATKDSLNDAFGKKFTNQIFKGISNGSLTTLEALEQISEKMNSTTIPTEKLQKVIVDTFGGPGEDAGLGFIRTLKDITKETDNLVDATNPMVVAQRKQLQLQKDIAAEQNALSKELAGTSAAMSTFGLQVKKVFFTQLRGVVDTMKDQAQAIGQIWDGFSQGNQALQSAGIKNLLRQIPIVDELAGKYLKLTDAEREAAAAQRVSNEVTDVALDLIETEIFDINNKVTALNDENLTQEQRDKLLKKILDKYPQYSKFLVDEEGNLKDIKKARASMNKAIIESAVSRAKEAIIAAKTQEIIQKELDLIRKRREASEEGFGTGVAEVFTLGFYTSASNEVDELGEDIDNNKDDLKALGKTLKEVQSNLEKTFADIDLDFGTTNFQESINDNVDELKSLQKQIRVIDAQLLSSTISDSMKVKLQEQKEGLVNQVKALEGVSAELKKAYLDFLEIGGDAEKESKKKGGGLAGGVGSGKTSKRKAKELDLLDKIRQKRAELEEESFDKAIELLNARIDREVKGFDQLRKETEGFRKQGLINKAEYERRMDEINQISGLAEEERQKEIDRIRTVWIDKEVKDRVDGFKKATDMSLVELQVSLEQEGQARETIDNRLAEERLKRLQNELALKKNLEEKRVKEIAELEAKEAGSGLTEEESSRLRALREAKSLDEEILALELEQVQVQSQQAEQIIRKVAALESVQVSGQIDQVGREISEQRALIDEMGDKVNEKELEKLKELMELRYQLRKRALEDEYDLQLSFLEEGSLDYQKVEQEKNNAIANLSQEHAENMKGINKDITDAQANDWRAFVEDLKETFGLILDRLEEIYAKALQSSEERLDKQSEAEDRQRERAEQGLSNTLAFEQQETAKREAELIAAQKRLERIQKIKALYAAYASNSSNPQVKNPIARTLRDFAILESITASFAEGGYTGDGDSGFGKNAGGWIKGVVEDGEFVVDKPTTKELKLKGLSMSGFKNRMLNKRVTNQANERKGLYQNDLSRQREVFMREAPAINIDFTSLEREVRELKEWQQANPPQKIEMRGLVDGLMEWVEEYVEDGIHKTFKHQAGRRRH